MAIQIFAYAMIPGDPSFVYRDITAYAPYATGGGGQESKIVIDTLVGGTGTLHFELYDPTNEIVVQARIGIRVYDDVALKYLFSGWVQKVRIRPVGIYRWIEVDAVDLNAVMDTTLVGALDPVHGTSSWWRLGTDPPTPFQLVDPSALIGSSDRGTVQSLFDAYWQFGWPFVIDTTTYVQEINGSMNTPSLTVTPYAWSRTTLAAMISEMCTYSSPTTVCWLDQQGNAHLTQIPDITYTTVGVDLYFGTTAADEPLARLLPQGISQMFPAPVALTDNTDGTGTGYEKFTYEEDSSGAMIFAFVNGATDFAYNENGVALIPDANGVMVSTVVPIQEVGGTGWVGGPGEGGGSPTWLARYIDIPQAINQGIRDGVGGAAVAKARLPLVRGHCEVWGTEDVWEAGMILTITNTPTHLSAQQFMIQRVHTTIVTATGNVLRRAALDWGTSAWTRLGLRAQAQQKAEPKKKGPGNQFIPFKGMGTYTQRYAGEVVDPPVSFQFTAPDGSPVAMTGIPASFGVTVLDVSNADVTADRDYILDPPGGAFSDPAGQVTCQLTLATNWVAGDKYVVFAVSPIS